MRMAWRFLMSFDEKFITNANFRLIVFRVSKEYSLQKVINQSAFDLTSMLNTRDIGFLGKYRYMINQQRFDKLISHLQNNKNFVWHKNIVVEVFKSMNSKAPAKHDKDDCQFLLSDYKGISIPLKIYEMEKETPNIIKEYVDWSEKPEIENLVKKRKMDEFYKLQFQKFKTRDKLVSFTLDNSGIASALLLQDIEKLIENLIKESVAFRNQSPEHAKLIKNKGYGTNRKYVRESDPILYTWYHQYQKRVMDLIQQFYRYTENPALAFDGNLLSRLGFQNCKGCCW